MNWLNRTLLTLLCIGLIVTCGFIRPAAAQLNPRVAPSDTLDVYLNEYQMLTARNTEWLTLQNGLWIILAAFIGLLVQVSGKLEASTVLWLSIIAGEVTLCAYSLIGCESYNNVFYIETTLRPRIVELTGEDTILGYESFVQGHRPLPQWIFDYGLSIIATAVIAAALVLSKVPQRRRILWLFVVVTLLVANWVLAHKAAAARRRIPVDAHVTENSAASPRTA